MRISISHPEQGAHAGAEDAAGHSDGDGQEEHGPYAEGAGQETAFAEQLEEFVDALVMG